MKNILFVAGFLLTGLPAWSQKDANAVKYAGRITAESARKHLSILASDEFEGRETGKPGAEKAARYIADEFKRLGLQAPVDGSYLMPVPLVESKVSLNFTANGSNLRPGYELYIPELHENKNRSASEVMFVGYGTEKEVGYTDLAGKIVVWINEDPPKNGTAANTSYQLTEDRAERVIALVRKGAAIIVGINREFGGVMEKNRESILESPMKVKTGDPLQNPGPVFMIGTDAMADILLSRSGKKYAALRDAAASGAGAIAVPVDIRFSYSVKSTDITASNVLGYIPGTDLKKELLVFSAHYDHIGISPENEGDKINNGADDDGSGTTAVLEIARAFSEAAKEGARPRRSILFLANVGEEKGLLGSEYYVDHPVFPLRNTIADLNIDMIGRPGDAYIGSPDSASYVYSVGSAMLSSELKQISETTNSTYTQLKLDYKYDDPNDPERLFYRSDHYNFAKNGIPVIFYTDGEHPDYHKPGDEVGKINFPLLVKRAQLAFYTGWTLANRDRAPLVDQALK